VRGFFVSERMTPNRRGSTIKAKTRIDFAVFTFAQSFGSFNYTGPANRSNDENILIVGDLEETKATAKSRQASIAKACREEIDRIRSEFGS